VRNSGLLWGGDGGFRRLRSRRLGRSRSNFGGRRDTLREDSLLWSRGGWMRICEILWSGCDRVRSCGVRSSDLVWLRRGDFGRRGSRRGFMKGCRRGVLCDLYFSCMRWSGI
jgi:hypothetical protein